MDSWDETMSWRLADMYTLPILLCPTKKGLEQVTGALSCLLRPLPLKACILYILDNIAYLLETTNANFWEDRTTRPFLLTNLDIKFERLKFHFDNREKAESAHYYLLINLSSLVSF